jgi:hypothetical protein
VDNLTLSSRDGNGPVLYQQEIAMTKLDSENRILGDDELTIDELDAASGGRIKIPKPAAVIAWEIAQIERDNPGF